MRVKTRPPAKGADFAAAVDLYDPAGAKAATDRWPADGRRPGVAKFPAALPGDHWIVLRAAGADAAAGGSYALSVKVVPAKANLRRRGGGDPDGGVAAIPFPAVEGSSLRGTIRGPVIGDLEILRPDGSTVPVTSLPAGDGGRRIPPFLLEGGTGGFVLRVPATGPLGFDLKVRPPRRGKIVESGD